MRNEVMRTVEVTITGISLLVGARTVVRVDNVPRGRKEG